VLVCLAGTVTLAALTAVTRVPPPLIDYLVQWATAAGILVWVSVGVVALRPVESLMRARGGARRGPLMPVVLCSLLVPLVGLAVARNSGLPPSDPNPRILAEGVARWLRDSADGVTVAYGGTARPVFLGTMAVGTGFVLELDKQGVAVSPPTSAQFGFRHVLPAQAHKPGWTVVVGLAGNLAPLPPGFVEVARSDTLVAFASRAP
jgi:hypothetical protein